jgi:hypothetical protein
VAAPLCPEIAAALGEQVRAAQCQAASPPVAGAAVKPRWTLRRLGGFVQAQFGRRCCRETIRRTLHRLKLSWQKAHKLLGRADPEQRQAFVAQIGSRLDGARDERHHLVYLDEAHIHQAVDLGYDWGERGKRFEVASSSPGLKAKVSFYGLSLYNEGQVRIWPYDRASGDHTIDVPRRLRAEIPTGRLIVLWDGAPSSCQGGLVRRREPGHPSAAAAQLHPDLMAVEPLWRWLREDVTYHHCHPTAEDLIRRVAAFEADVNAEPYTNGPV